MSKGMAPVKLLLDRSSVVILVQFLRPLGNGPWRPKLLRRNARTRFSSGCQHSTPGNLHMKPTEVLSKTHEDFSMPVGSVTDCLTSLRHWTSRSELKQLLLSSKRRRAPRPRAKWSVIEHFGGIIQLLPGDVTTPLLDSSFSRSCFLQPWRKPVARRTRVCFCQLKSRIFPINWLLVECRAPSPSKQSHFFLLSSKEKKKVLQ